MKQKKYLIISFVASLLSILTFIYLTLHYYDVQFGSSDGNAICNIGAYFNCDVVSASKYAQVFGIPIALFGLMTQLIITLLMTLAHFHLSYDEDKTLRHITFLNTIAWVASILMAFISFVLIQSACLFCVVIYVLSTISFIFIYLATKNISPFGHLINDIQDLFSKNKGTLFLYLLIPAGAWTAHSILLEGKGMSKINEIAKEKVAIWKQAPSRVFDNTTGLILYHGTGTPKNTIVEFADYRCPHCKHANPSLHTFIKSHPDTQLIYKPFPLDGTCNDAIKGGGDGISCGLAYFVMCSEKINNNGWKIHDYLFDNQDKIRKMGDIQKLNEMICTDNNLSCDSLISCTQSSEIIDLVRKTAKEGEQAQISGTPSIFFNNRSLMGGQLLPILEMAYQNK